MKLKKTLRRRYRLIRSHVDAWRWRGHFRGLQAYCMFIGYPRSGHSLIGEWINAHPNAAIAHELNLPAYLSGDHSRDRLFGMIIRRTRHFAENKGYQGSGYTYRIPNQWQGRFDRLLVIGDKRGGAASRLFGEDPELLARLRTTVALPLRVIHVTRNPFDNIATICRRHQLSLDAATDFYLDMADGAHSSEAELTPDELLVLRHEAVLVDPTKHLERICIFLGIDPDPQYIHDCVSMANRSPRRTRTQIDWPVATIRRIEAAIADYPRLSHYAFDSD